MSRLICRKGPVLFLHVFPLIEHMFWIFARIARGDSNKYPKHVLFFFFCFFFVFVFFFVFFFLSMKYNILA